MRLAYIFPLALAATSHAVAQSRPIPMILAIPAWPDGQQIPVKFTQAGEQVSPELKWTGVPEGTKSFVVNMLDPDVAVQKSPEAQPHWIVWNIPATSTGLPEGVKAGAELPDGTRQISASGPQLSRTRSRRDRAAPSLYVRGVRARHEDRRAAVVRDTADQRGPRDSSSRDESDAGTRAR